MSSSFKPYLYPVTSHKLFNGQLKMVIFKVRSSIDWGLPRWLSGKEICLPRQEPQEMRVWSLGRESSLEEEMATYSSILARAIPWAEEPGGVTWGHKELDTTEQLSTALAETLKPPQKCCRSQTSETVWVLLKYRCWFSYQVYHLPIVFWILNFINFF